MCFRLLNRFGNAVRVLSDFCHSRALCRGPTHGVLWVRFENKVELVPEEAEADLFDIRTFSSCVFA